MTGGDFDLRAARKEFEVIRAMASNHQAAADAGERSMRLQAMILEFLSKQGDQQTRAMLAIYKDLVQLFGE